MIKITLLKATDDYQPGDKIEVRNADWLLKHEYAVEGWGTDVYDTVTVSELKELLSARGLPVYGRKAELIARLRGG